VAQHVKDVTIGYGNMLTPPKVEISTAIETEKGKKTNLKRERK
jgi:hypothetical protein